MVTKDYVYLALIAFAALTFYFHGYAVGVADRRRKQKSARRPLEVSIQTTAFQQPASSLSRNSSEPLKVVDAIRCSFGNN